LAQAELNMKHRNWVLHIAYRNILIPKEHNYSNMVTDRIANESFENVAKFKYLGKSE
jgi:hypothetical protein